MRVIEFIRLWMQARRDRKLRNKLFILEVKMARETAMAACFLKRLGNDGFLVGSSWSDYSNHVGNVAALEIKYKALMREHG